MKRRTIFTSIISAGIALAACTTNTGKETPLQEPSEILFADPTIFEDNGIYYLAGTRSCEPLGFALLESDDLVNWRHSSPDSMILRADGPSFGSKWFWAPQIIKDNDKYLLSYTAQEQVAVAYADSLPSLFAQPEIKPVDSSERNIDSFLFKDDDGKWYLYHVRFGGGNYIWTCEFDPVTGSIVEGTLTKCFVNTQPWEHTEAYESEPIMEGPTVVKLDGKYYLFYSANHYMSPDYAVGYAVAETPFGPWEKNPENPIIHRSIVGENGSGHGDLFVGPDGRFRYVYHVHNSDSVVAPRRTRIVALNFDKDNETGIYGITADTATIVKPMVR